MWLIDGVVRPYAWGDPDFIPDLLGRPSDGTPQAELWFGTHPDSPSPVVDGGVLSDFVELPFLVKVLSASEPLSIQAHPDAAGAIAGFEAEDAAGVPRTDPRRNYRDRSHKPELMCALTPFRAAAGFEELPVVAKRLAALDPQWFGPLQAAVCKGGAEAGARWILALDDDLSATVDSLIASVGQHPLPDALQPVAEGVVDAFEAFGADPGVVMLVLMRHVTLQPGDGLFLPARRMHGYLRGSGVEVMANSDNVIRGGLTQKHIDVDELMRTVDFKPGGISPQRANGATQRYEVGVDDFAVERISITSAIDRQPSGGPMLILSTGGSLTVDSVVVAPGQALCLGPDAAQVRLEGTATAWIVTSGQS